ncbi:MAG: alanine racemase, partial [Proteobacteria bacterium]|nr:alanine racemase [Pseudomonadota bacterium]
MNLVPDPKTTSSGSLLSPEANAAAEFAAATATATGVLTVDLDAIVANWRKLEKTAVPAECAGVIKADAYGCGAGPVARALAAAGCKTFFVATLDEARAARAAAPSTDIYVLDGFFQNSGAAFAEINCRPVIGDLNELAEWDVF